MRKKTFLLYEDRFIIFSVFGLFDGFAKNGVNAAKICKSLEKVLLTAAKDPEKVRRV